METPAAISYMDAAVGPTLQSIFSHILRSIDLSLTISVIIYALLEILHHSDTTGGPTLAPESRKGKE